MQLDSRPANDQFDDQSSAGTKMKTWQVQDAKAHFSELLDTCIAEGPQLVTRRGADAAVLVPVEQWRRLEQQARPTLKDLLLAPHPRADLVLPPRGQPRRAPPALS
jgi:antitoxin Phd